MKMYVIAEIEINGKGEQKDIRIELPKNAKKITGVKVDTQLISTSFPPSPPYVPPVIIPQASLVNVVNLEQVNWTNVIGNGIAYIFYTGIEPNNPSGNKNIKEMIYRKNGTLLFKEVYKYDNDDDVIDTECLAI